MSNASSSFGRRSAWPSRSTSPLSDEGNGTLLTPVLGIVRGQSGAEIVVEVAAEAGGLVLVTAPAIHHAAYAVGDRVLVIFAGAEAQTAIVAGRVGEEADALTPAHILAALLGVDGPGSTLDADTLDGAHESALLRADGTRPLAADWDVGAGRRLRTARVQARATDGLELNDRTGVPGLFVEEGGRVGVGHRAPLCALDVRAAADGLLAYYLVDDGADTAGMALYAYTDDYATGYLANSVMLYAPAGTPALILAAAAAAGELRFTAGGFPSAATERMRLTPAGLGIGVTAPQGRLHVWDGTGGLLLASRTAIGATAQTILPNGAGDVTALARIEAIVSNGTNTLFDAFTLSGASSYAVTVGSDVYTFRRNADGSLDVRRTAGSASGSAVVRVLWM